MLARDLRFAFRMMWKSPTFTSVAIAALALGIGANTAIFSIVHAVLLRPLPYPEPDRLVRLYERAEGELSSISPPNFVDWKSRNRTFAAIAAYNGASLTLTGKGEPQQVPGATVDPDLFHVLSVMPALGRPFAPDDARPGASRVAVLSDGLWRRQFGGDPAAIGRTLVLDAEPHEIVGVMPRGFDFPEGADLLVPLVLTEANLNARQRGAHWLSAVGRLAPGVSLAQGRSDLTAIEADLARQFKQVEGFSADAIPMLDSMTADVRKPLVLLLGAVAFVLLIACVNVSNLLLARATSRRAEIAVRAALGASRWQIFRQMLAESMMLSLAGSAAAVILAAWTLRGLEFLLPEDLPRSGAIAINAPVLAFSIAVAFVAALVFGAAPAAYASRFDLAAFLKDARRDGSGAAGRRRFRSGLVSLEIALALVLLAAAGLALRSFDRLTAVDPGFDPRNVLAITLSIPEARYPDPPSRARFYRELVDALGQQPGISSAGGVMLPPLSTASYYSTFSVSGRAWSDDALQVRAATPGYFETLRIPLRRGRLLGREDREGGAPVVVISELAARQFWPGEDPIGKRLRLHAGMSGPEREREVVGIVGDVRTRALDAAPAPVAYVPHAQYVSDFMTVFVRTAGDPLSALPAVKSQLAAIDREVPISRVATGDAIVAASVGQPRFRMILLSAFASIALLLAAVGVYGVMAYSVTQRRTELAVRMALGADHADILRMILLQALAPMTLGIGAGLAAALVATRYMEGLLYETSRFDIATIGGVSLILAAVGVLASYLPARRAASVDPLISMRM